MSYVNTAYRGLDALKEGKYDAAIQDLTVALSTSLNPAWIIARSKALVGARRFREALEDAELGWHVASSRNKRELIIEAQHRRAVAHLRLGELANADCCCIYAMRLIKGGKVVEAEDPARAHTDADGFWKDTAAMARAEADEENSSSREKDISGSMGHAMQAASDKTKQWRVLSMLRLQILSRMDSLPERDPARRCTVEQMPPKRGLSKLDSTGKEAEESTPAEPEASAVSKGAPRAAAWPVASDVKLQEFQTNETISVSVMSKGVDKSKLKVDFQPSKITLDPIIYPNGEEKEYVLVPWADVDPSLCDYAVTPSKVELRLRKQSPGKWGSIERTEGAEPPRSTPVAVQHAQPPPAVEQKQPAPSSSKQDYTKWDSLGVDDEDDESDVNQFFKKLYKNATPEQQRAMMKSFTESSGTSLSTDWDDVKGRTVDAVPPEGVEAKKWSDK